MSPLDYNDKALILNDDRWLNYKIFDAVNSMLSRRVGANANQSTLLAQTTGFSQSDTRSPFRSSMTMTIELHRLRSSEGSLR